MKNRYDHDLRDSIKEIRALIPASETLSLVMAFELGKHYKPGDKVLEIGCGKGDSAKFMLDYTKAKLDLLDISPEMIASCKRNLSKYKKRLHYICSDAFKYLKKCAPYNIILSSWTIHNFKKKEQRDLLKAIYTKLQPGGLLIIMEKVYPNRKSIKALDEMQIRRYQYLNPRVRRMITAHDINDHKDQYRIDERPFIQSLKNVGFRKVELIDRVEMTLVLIAYK